MVKETQRKLFTYTMVSFSIIILSISLVINVVSMIHSTKDSYTRVAIIEDTLKKMQPPHLKDNAIVNDGIKESIGLYSEITKTYLVTLKGDKIVNIINTSPNSYSNEQLATYSQDVLKKNKVYGAIDKFIYKVQRNGDLSTVIYMDNSMENEALKRNFMVTLTWSILALLCSYFVSRKISRCITNTEEDILEKQKKFISNVGNELKIPLSIIRENIEMVSGDENKEYRDYIQNELTSMDSLVNKLLTLSKIGGSKKDTSEESFDLSKVVLGEVFALESLAKEFNVSIIESVESGIILNGNVLKFKQLLSILLDNAMKHTYEKGIVVVNLRDEKKKIILEVKSTGDVIPENKEELIFEKFYKVDKSKNIEYKRYVLGLAIAKLIVAKFNGDICVGRDNEYTVFTVTLSK